jgi:putative transposase
VLVAPLIPPARRGGRRRSINEREVLNAIFYVLATGCQWQALPKDLPPKSTAHLYFQLWDWDGTLDRRIHEALYVAVREVAGREASKSDAIIDFQRSAKGGSSLAPQGFDAGKKVTRRERHILVDTLGFLLGVSVLPANIQDRDGARDLLQRARRRFPFIERIFADASYQGPKMPKVAAATGLWLLEIVKRSISTALSFCPQSPSDARLRTL